MYLLILSIGVGATAGLGDLGAVAQRAPSLGQADLPLVQVDFDPLGIDAESLFGIAEQLTDQLALEAA